MANIRVKNVSRETAQSASSLCPGEGLHLGEIIVEAIEREVSRREWHKRFSGSPSIQLRISAAQMLEEERRQRDRDLR